MSKYTSSTLLHRGPGNEDVNLNGLFLGCFWNFWKQHATGIGCELQVEAKLTDKGKTAHTWSSCRLHESGCRVILKPSITCSTWEFHCSLLPAPPPIYSESTTESTQVVSGNSRFSCIPHIFCSWEPSNRSKVRRNGEDWDLRKCSFLRSLKIYQETWHCFLLLQQD